MPRSTFSASSAYLRTSSQVRSERSFFKGFLNTITSKKNSDLDNFIAIGIDFGTTYSGASWATATDLQNAHINVVSDWPGYDREEGKAPTKLYYDKGSVKWGYGIPEDADPVQWFKLLLVRDEDLTDSVRNSEFLLRARRMLEGKSAVDYVADYLEALWQHTLQAIRKVRRQSTIDQLVFHVVITVPAIWKDYALADMKQAAKKAGITRARSAGPTRLTFIPEPEAAALVTLVETGITLITGKVYIVCDAGGGTVDLISYKVGELDPIQLHEAAVGTGGLCGAIFIDQAFEAMCKARLGRRWSSLSSIDIKKMMETQWEYNIKPRFTPSTSGAGGIVAIPGCSDMTDMSRRPYIKHGHIYFSSSDIQKAFSQVFTEIEELIDDQIRLVKKQGLSVDRIILVGGLGTSRYLKEYLRNRRTAICRGAVIKGFLDAPDVPTPVRIVSAIARRSIGVIYDPDFREGIHDPKYRCWDEMSGTFRAYHQMKWYMKKGDKVLKDEPIRHSFTAAFESEDDFDAMIQDPISIRQCDDDIPPVHYSRRVNELCTISIDTTDITYDSLKYSVAPNGRRLKVWSIYIKMMPSGASTAITVWSQGMLLGSGHVRIEFD
ncbi:hypothetical protein BDW59DRAFT_177072 [Aspergillus cavernicola]|uniref:Actin-like ATPase domain-containing protein n=1 Tax=Aspergillus cavernicola TaxID=176166 RepID=A0ABR4H854_9EURO